MVCPLDQAVNSGRQQQGGATPWSSSTAAGAPGGDPPGLPTLQPLRSGGQPSELRSEAHLLHGHDYDHAHGGGDGRGRGRGCGCGHGDYGNCGYGHHDRRCRARYSIEDGGSGVRRAGRVMGFC